MTEKRSSKRLKVEAKDESDFSSILLHNEDCLIQCLARTNSKDHAALKCVCKTFSGIMDSPKFLRERMVSEWAEVTVPVDGVSGNFSVDPPPVMKNRAKIYVDGKLAGSTDLIYVDRKFKKGYDPFYDCIDEMGEHDALSDVIRLFFTKMFGRPKLKSLREATRGKDGDKINFLFIDNFELKDVYRQHSWVGACALGQIREFRFGRDIILEWSIAIYTGDGKMQLRSEQDKEKIPERLEQLQKLIDSGNFKESDVQEKNQLEQKLEDLTIVDLRQFLRAGFQQPTEAVANRKYYVFCALDNLVGDPKALMTHQEAESIPIARRPPPTGEVASEHGNESDDDSNFSHDESCWCGSDDEDY